MTTSRIPMVSRKYFCFPRESTIHQESKIEANEVSEVHDAEIFEYKEEIRHHRDKKDTMEPVDTGDAQRAGRLKIEGQWHDWLSIGV
jgi:hypothetical protein